MCKSYYPQASADELVSYIATANTWLHARSRYKNVIVKLINTVSTENFKAEFIVKDGIHYINVYKDAMVSFYNKYGTCTSRFDMFFASIIVHELTHRRQYMTVGKKNFTLFKTLYNKDKNKFELPAIQNEIRFINYIVCGRVPSIEIDRFYI